MFIVGILTVAGYSVNDTIVIFDRIRENVIRYPTGALDSVVNLSIVETVGRPSTPASLPSPCSWLCCSSAAPASASYCWWWP